MTASPPLPDRAHNRPRNTPAKVLAAFCLIVLATTTMSGLQHRQRTLLEHTEAPTAVGDHAYFERPQPLPWNQSVAALDDQRLLFLQSETPVARDDSRMLKVAWWRRYHVYQQTEDPQTDRFYLKIDKGSYLPLGPEPRNPAETP